LRIRKQQFLIRNIPSEPQISIKRLKLTCFWCLNRDFLYLEITKPAFQDNPDLKVQALLAFAQALLAFAQALLAFAQALLALA